MFNLLVVDDEYSIRSILKEAFEEEEGYEIELAECGKEALDLIKNNEFDLVITDLVMDELDGIELMEESKSIEENLGFIIITAYGTIKTAVKALKKGAYDFITKPFSISHIRSRVERYFEYEGLKEENKKLKKKLSQEKRYDQIVGKSEEVKEIYNKIDLVAEANAPVFLQGESGTGKELIAQAIHDNSNRADEPFLKVNCSAIPETLFESTLFGHEKGAFTHAIKTKKGLFEEADGGTLLLDEISETPPPMQAKLLRVLQEEVISRVGSAEEIPVDVRIIATTNRDIQKRIEEDQFRSDLFFRLNVFPIEVPPLRHRIEDIPVLVNHFIEKFKPKYGYEDKTIDQKALDELMNKRWPGNVRQLENLVERAILYSGNEEKLKLKHFSLETEPLKSSDNSLENEVMTIDEMERKLILRTLKKTDNNRTKAAELLDISVRTLRNKLNKYEEMGIEVPSAR